MSENQIGDTNIIQRLPTSGIPLDTSDYSYISYTVAASSINTLTITTDTTVKELSLFNWAFTMFVESDSTDYIWPTGAALTSTTRSLRVYHYQDWYTSNDKTNKKVYKYHVENYSGSTRTIFLYFKAYTYAYIAGATGESSE